MDEVILHCDANNFFASVELLSRPDLRGVPVAVASMDDGRHGVILSKNDLAKPFGVKTGESVLEATKKCPRLALIRPSRGQYSRFSQLLNAIYLRYTDMVERASIDESYMNVTDCGKMFGSGREIADGIRAAVKNETGLTVSVGVSFNKLFAKMGSDYKKPDATTEITRENFRDILYPLKIGALMGVGDAMEAALNRVGIATIGDAARRDIGDLEKIAGKAGEYIYLAVRGEIREEVRRNGEYDRPKSIGNGETYINDLRGFEEIDVELLRLTDSIAMKLRLHGLLAGTVALQIKDSRLKTISRQTALQSPTSSTGAIFKAARELTRVNWRNDEPVRMLTVTLSGLVFPGDGVQTSIFDADCERDDKLYKALDEIRVKYGTRALLPASLVAERVDEARDE